MIDLSRSCIKKLNETRGQNTQRDVINNQMMIVFTWNQEVVRWKPIWCFCFSRRWTFKCLRERSFGLVQPEKDPVCVISMFWYYGKFYKITYTTPLLGGKVRFSQGIKVSSFSMDLCNEWFMFQWIYVMNDLSCVEVVNLNFEPTRVFVVGVCQVTTGAMVFRGNVQAAL